MSLRIVGLGIIENGMYIRTKNGLIGKIIDIGKGLHEQYQLKLEDGIWYDFETLDVSKKSEDIFDIIDNHDVVNGIKINKYNTPDSEWLEDSISGYNQIFIDEIKTIVTHEQMERIAYKVGE